MSVTNQNVDGGKRELSSMRRQNKLRRPEAWKERRAGVSSLRCSRRDHGRRAAGGDVDENER